MPTAEHRPLRLDLDGTNRTSGVVAEARPLPILGSGDEAPYDWVLVHVVQLLHAPRVVVHIEVVIALLPEWALGAAKRDGEFERVDRVSNCALARLADEQMDVLGHDDVSSYNKLQTVAGALKSILKEAARGGSPEMRKPMETTERDEVEVTGLVVTNKSARHWCEDTSWNAAGVGSYFPGCEHTHPGHPCSCWSEELPLGIWAPGALWPVEYNPKGRSLIGCGL